MLTWHFASPEEFYPICELFRSSELGKDLDIAAIQRRITLPILLNQLITFRENGELCGFITFALLSDEAEKHMPSVGILPQDWRSGENFWAVDFISKTDGFKMLRIVTKGLGVKSCRYFRHKFKQTREVRCLVAV